MVKIARLLFLLGSFMVLSAGVATPQTLTRSQHLALLQQANQAFEDALASPEASQAQRFYRQAIAAYEQLIAAGIDNAKLYYNLANVYFRLNDLGRAILFYRRGLRLEPGNARLLANLRYARSRRVDQFENTMGRALLPALFFWHDDLTLSTQRTLAVTGFWFVWVCAFGHLFWRRPAWLWALAGAALVCLIFTTSAFMVHIEHAAARHGVIVAPEAVVRKGNGESYAPQFPQPLHPGAEFTVLEGRSSWLHVQLENGAHGWIRQDQAEQW